MNTEKYVGLLQINIEMQDSRWPYDMHTHTHTHTHTHHRIYASRSNLKYEEVKRVFGDNGLSVCKM